MTFTCIFFPSWGEVSSCGRTPRASRAGGVGLCAVSLGEGRGQSRADIQALVLQTLHAAGVFPSMSGWSPSGFNLQSSERKCAVSGVTELKALVLSWEQVTVLKFPRTSCVKDAKQPACGGRPPSLGDGSVHFSCVPGACILGNAWCPWDRQPARRGRSPTNDLRVTEGSLRATELRVQQSLGSEEPVSGLRCF